MIASIKMLSNHNDGSNLRGYSFKMIKNRYEFLRSSTETGRLIRGLKVGG